MKRNVASQIIEVFAFDHTTGEPKTGDAANLTVYVAKDDGFATVLGDTSAAEISSTNAAGWYRFDLTQAETNAYKLHFTGKSTTANVAVVGRVLYTEVDVVRFGNAAGAFASGRPEVNTTHAAGTAWNSGAIGENTLASNTIVAAKIGDGAFTAGKFPADALQALLIGGINGVTFPADFDTLDIQDRGLPLSGPGVAAVVAAIEAEIADDATGLAVKQAIVDKLLANLPDIDDLSLSAIASAARDAILDRVLSGNHEMAGSVGKLLQKLNVAGTLAHSGDAATYKADVSGLALEATAQSALTQASGANTKAGAVQTVLAGITSLAQWLGLLAGRQVGDSTARTELRATGAGSGTFNEATDALEALRDRGDAAWTTGAGGGGGGGLSGPSAVTLSFKDAANAAVPLVDFTVVGQGSGRADASGVASFGLADGTYSVVARPTSAVSFAAYTLDVDGVTEATITGTSVVIAPPPAPGLTTAYAYLYDAEGDPIEGDVLSYRLSRGAEDAGAAYDRLTRQSSPSAADGLVQVTLIKGAWYDAWFRGGTRVRFRTTQSDVQSIPVLHGRFTP